jgi:branched-chain amino acid transport system substrate-binding protein
MIAFAEIRRRLFRSLVFAAVMLAATLATTSAQTPIEFGAAAGDADYTLGCLYPMSGPGALYGQDSLVAISMAIEEIEAQSEFSGYPRLRVVVEDSLSKRFRGVQIAQHFIENIGVDALCGVVSSSVALAVTAVAREAGVLFIGTDHASPRLTGEAFHPYYFRMSNSSRTSMQAGAAYIATHLAQAVPLRIAFVGPDYDYGYHQWDDLRRYLAERSVAFEVVAELWPRLHEVDYDPYIRALIYAEPDLVVNGHWGGDAVAFIEQADALGLFEATRFMNFDAGGNYEVLASLGERMPLGLVLSARHHNNWPDTSENRAFVSKFFERSGRYPSYSAQGAYAAILAVATAYRDSGSYRPDSDTMRRELENLVLKLPEDPEGFESYMDATSHEIQQVHAIGETVPGSQLAPATVELGNWFVFYPEDAIR